MNIELANMVRVLASEVMLKDILNKEDIKLLKHRAPILMYKVKELSRSKKKNPLNELSPEDKRVLMAYVVSVRQNASTGKDDNPNLEDAARIMHDDIYNTSNKDEVKKLEKELKKQLSKIGIVLK